MFLDPALSLSEGEREKPRATKIVRVISLSPSEGERAGEGSRSVVHR